MLILEIHDVYKAFRSGFLGTRQPVLSGVSLAIEAGEVYGFLGHNGAGKTTTMKIALGLLRADGGEVRLFGQTAVPARVRAHVGYLSEEIGLYPHLNAVETLQLTGELFRIPRRRLATRIDEMLAAVGLETKRAVKVKHYSKGMRQRLGIATAMINDPDLLLLDEPYSGLDPVGRKDLRELLLGLKRQGKTILMSSHIVPDVEAVCDRVGILSGGRIARVLDLNELYAEQTNDVEVVLSGVPSGRVNARDYGGEDVLVDERVRIVRVGGDRKLRMLVDDVYDAGGRVVGVRQVRLNLEDIFVDEVARTPGAEDQDTIAKPELLVTE
jgi:ABC-2 type transport system ATP-binding protein